MIRTVAASLLLAFAASAFAQAFRGELAAGAYLDVGDAQAAAGWSLSGRLEVAHAQAPLTASIVAASTLHVHDEPRLELRVSEALIRYRSGDLDVSVGLERLVLETARSSVPFAVGPAHTGGLRAGVPGVQLRCYGDRLRLRLAAFYADGALAGAISLRREFDRADIEGHVVTTLGGMALGLSGSGLVGATVVYGEAWLLTDPLEPRAALGATGVVGDVQWTLEMAYLATPGGPSGRPTLAVLLAGPAAGHAQWRVTSTAFMSAHALEGHAAVALTWREPERDVGVEAGASLGPGGARLRIGVETRSYF